MGALSVKVSDRKAGVSRLLWGPGCSFSVLGYSPGSHGWVPWNHLNISGQAIIWLV